MALVSTTSPPAESGKVLADTLGEVWIGSPAGPTRVGQQIDGSSLTDLYSDRMVRRMTAIEAKARLLSLLNDVASGDEVEITSDGRVVARLVPAGGPNSPGGKSKGLAMTAAHDAELFTTGAAWNLR